MRATAIGAAVVVGAALGWIIGVVADLATGVEGILSAVGLLAGMVGLPVLVARLVPSSRAGKRGG